MEKIETIAYTKEKRTHHFYCDDCNKYLGKTEEYDDGWYPELGEIELAFHFFGDRYKVNKCFCDECRENYSNKIKDALVGLGFKQGWL